MPTNQSIADELKGQKIVNAYHVEEDGGYWVAELESGPEFSFRFMTEIVAAEQQAKLSREFDEQQAGTRPREYPEGRMGLLDEGALLLKVGEANGKICIEFAKSVQWLAMPPEMAMALAASLIQKCEALRGGK